MTCENCIHYEICNENADGAILELMKDPCFRFFELVRCKDCKDRESSEFCECRPEDAFCSDGERKTDE